MFSAPLAPNQCPNLIAFPQPAKTVDYLEITFETFLDQVLPLQGFILLDQQGGLIQSSPRGRLLCQTLQIGSESAEAWPNVTLPPAIHNLAQSLIESRSLFPEKDFQLQDDVVLEDNTQVRLQARWVSLGAQYPACIVVILIDLTEEIRQRAVFDAYQYQLTQREMEVWSLHLQGYSYQQMGEALSIAINTVKKHMKSILSKRRAESCSLD
jgi:DNA-binding CsgD family transcriptional regulator